MPEDHNGNINYWMVFFWSSRDGVNDSRLFGLLLILNEGTVIRHRFNIYVYMYTLL